MSGEREAVRLSVDKIQVRDRSARRRERARARPLLCEIAAAACRRARAQAVVEETLLLSWNVQQLGHKIDLLLNSRLPADSWLNFESESKRKFGSAYSKLGGKTPVRAL